MRLGITHEGRGPGAWSGIPLGLATGIRAQGHEAVLVTSNPDRVTSKVVRAMGRVRPISKASPWLATIASAEVRVRRRRVGPVDVWVQMGSKVGAPEHPFVTYDDMTVAQLAGSAYASDLKPSTRRRWMERQASVYERAIHCFVASDWTAASLRDDYGIPPTKIDVVGFGRNHDTPPPPDRDWRQPRFLWIGFEWERKNGPAVLDAFRRIRAEVPWAELDLVGGHPELREPGVVGHGILPHTGSADPTPIHPLLARATCLVVPSRTEAFGIAYVEAAGAGAPSIGTTEGGASTAVGPGGILVDPSDPDALYDAMSMMCDPATAARYGALALQHGQQFTWPKIAAVILDRCAGALSARP